MSNPLIHCSSCTLGVGRSRSVKFALVRTRRKGGGACELSSAELPLIRPFASLAGTSRAATVRVFWRTRVCIFVRDGRAPSWIVCERLIDALFPRDRRVSRRDRSELRNRRQTFWSTRRSPVRSFVGISFISLRSVELSAEAFLRFGLVGLF